MQGRASFQNLGMAINRVIFSEKKKQILLNSLRNFTFLWRLYHLSIRIAGVSRIRKNCGKSRRFFENFKNFFINYRIFSEVINQKNKIVEDWGVTLSPLGTLLTHRILECILTLALLPVNFSGVANATNCPLVARQWICGEFISIYKSSWRAIRIH